jgi:hypothetical protein
MSPITKHGMTTSSLVLSIINMSEKKRTIISKGCKLDFRSFLSSILIGFFSRILSLLSKARARDSVGEDKIVAQNNQYYCLSCGYDGSQQTCTI